MSAGRRNAPRRSASVLPSLGSLLGLLLGSAAAAGLPIDRMPLDAARYCNRSCPAASCSAVCRLPDDCASSCTRRGVPVCRCRHGRQT